jgi:anthranilate phosphoribosyltransferase
MADPLAEGDAKTSITPLLKRLWHETPANKPSADEIAAALSLIFTNSLSEVQTGALLTCLHFTDEDRKADVLAKCSKAMRDFATKIDVEKLEVLLKERGRKEGSYGGGLVRSTAHLSYLTVTLITWES